MEFDIRIGDTVRIKNSPIVGIVTYIDSKGERADVEWEEYDYTKADAVRIESLEKL